VPTEKYKYYIRVEKMKTERCIVYYYFIIILYTHYYKLLLRNHYSPKGHNITFEYEENSRFQ